MARPQKQSNDPQLSIEIFEETEAKPPQKGPKFIDVLKDLLNSKEDAPKEFTSIDLFSGCGGMTKGFEYAGVRSIFASDIDENCEKTFTRN